MIRYWGRRLKANATPTVTSAVFVRVADVHFSVVSLSGWLIDHLFVQGRLICDTAHISKQEATFLSVCLVRTISLRRSKHWSGQQLIRKLNSSFVKSYQNCRSVSWSTLIERLSKLSVSVQCTATRTCPLPIEACSYFIPCIPSLSSIFFLRRRG